MSVIRPSMASRLRVCLGGSAARAPDVMLLDVGGVLTPDPWQTLLLTPGDGIADRLGADRTEFEEAATRLWPEFSLEERSEVDWWLELSRAVEIEITADLVKEVEDRLLQPIAGAAELISEARRICDVGVVSDNTWFWYRKQSDLLGLDRLTMQPLRFLSFERGVSKETFPVGLFEVASESLTGRQVVVVDDRDVNCQRAEAAGLIAIRIDPLSKASANA